MSNQRIRGEIISDLEVEVVRVYRSYFGRTPMVDIRVGGKDDSFVRSLEVGDVLSFPYRIELQEC